VLAKRESEEKERTEKMTYLRKEGSPSKKQEMFSLMGGEKELLSEG